MATLWACFALPELPLESLEKPGPKTRDPGLGGVRAESFDSSGDRVAGPPVHSGFPESRVRNPESRPFAVHDGAAQRPTIVCANSVARAAGIRAGMALAQAQALVPELLAQRHDPQAQARRLELLGALAYGFSSQVVLDPPDAVLLEIGASRGLFGDWPDIERALRTRLAELGHRHTLAAAPTPAAARVLAGLADGYAVAQPQHLLRVLARVPIGSARLSAEHAEELQRIGARTLNDVFVLPRAALARRFGQGLLQELDWLRGTEPDPRPPYRPADRFERRIAFDYGIARQDALRFSLQRLAREFAAFLHARDGGVLRFALRFEHDPLEQDRHRPATAATVLDVGLRKPCRDADALFEAAWQALERVALPAPAHALALVAEDLPPFAPELRDLFDPGLRGSLDLDALAERLRARLGEGVVRELALHADHRPERAWRIADAPAPYRQDKHEIARQDIVAALPRPLWLLPRPIPLRGRIVRIDGTPERIETGWWDDDDVRRDYAIVELENGQRAWLYRTVDAANPTPVQNADHCAQGWMLQGWFA